MFNRLVAAYIDHEIDSHWFLAEELLRGELATVEGYAWEGGVEVIGSVDSTLHGSGSFARFDYPSALPEEVQERLARVEERLGYRMQPLAPGTGG